MKKFLSIILVSISLITQNVFASQNVNYVAIGDSISTGYGLDDYNFETKNVDSFVNLLDKQLNTNTINLAVDGIDSTEFLTMLKTMDNTQKEILQKADIITLTIGGNNILKPLKKAINMIQITHNKIITPREILTIIFEKDKDYFENFISEVTSNVLKFTGTEQNLFQDGDFFKIIEELRLINNDAQILVQTIYNPYKKLELPTEFNLLIETALNSMNTTIKQNATLTEKYMVVDIYTTFNESNFSLTNAFIEFYITFIKIPIKVDFDPHPNKFGHYLIYLENLKILSK